MGAFLPGELGGLVVATGDQVLAKVFVAEDTMDFGGEGCGLIRRGQQRGTAGDFFEGAAGGRDHWTAEGHRFQDGEAEAFVPAREDKNPGVFEKAGHPFVRDIVQMGDAFADGGFGQGLLNFFGPKTPGSGQDQVFAAALLAKDLEAFDDADDVLAFFQSP